MMKEKGKRYMIQWAGGEVLRGLEEVDEMKERIKVLENQPGSESSKGRAKKLRKVIEVRWASILKAISMIFELADVLFYFG